MESHAIGVDSTPIACDSIARKLAHDEFRLGRHVFDQQQPKGCFHPYRPTLPASTNILWQPVHNRIPDSSRGVSVSPHALSRKPVRLWQSRWGGTQHND